MSTNSNKQAQCKHTPGEEHWITLSGVVDKIIDRPGDSAKAQITIRDAEELYRELRVSNVFCDGNGNRVSLEQGTEVEITIKVRAGQKSPSASDSSTKAKSAA